MADKTYFITAMEDGRKHYLAPMPNNDPRIPKGKHVYYFIEKMDGCAVFKLDQAKLVKRDFDRQGVKSVRIEKMPKDKKVLPKEQIDRTVNALDRAIKIANKHNCCTAVQCPDGMGVMLVTPGSDGRDVDVCSISQEDWDSKYKSIFEESMKGKSAMIVGNEPFAAIIPGDTSKEKQDELTAALQDVTPSGQNLQRGIWDGVKVSWEDIVNHSFKDLHTL